MFHPDHSTAPSAHEDGGGASDDVEALGRGSRSFVSRASASFIADLPAAPVAVFDGDSPPALAFTRSLGRAGIPVHVYGHNPWPAARLSRYATRFFRCPDPEDAARFLPWLEREIRNGCIARVAPTSDLIAWYLAELRPLFPALIAASMPSLDAVLDVLFKDRFARRALELGIPTPITLAPSSVEEACDLAHDVAYPAVIKPRSHVVGRLERGIVVDDADALRARYRPTGVPRGMRDVLLRYPTLCFPVVQEYIPGALQRLYSVSGLLGEGGQVLAYAGSQKRQQWPPRLGVGLAFEQWDDEEACASGVDIARRFLGAGFFELELILDRRTGSYVAIDLNPRAHGFLGFDIARGNDLPVLWARAPGRNSARPSRSAEEKLRWVHSMPLHVAHWVNIAYGPRRAAAVLGYAEELRAPHIDIVHDARDPLPTVRYAMTMLRHPGGLVRPFLEEKRRERRGA